MGMIRAIQDYFKGDYQAFYSRHLTRIKKVNADEFTAQCPFHENERPCLAFNNGSGRFYCRECGKKGHVIDFYVYIKGLDRRRDFGRILRGIKDDFGIPWSEKKRRTSREGNTNSQSDIEAIPKNISEKPTRRTLEDEGDLENNTQNYVILNAGWVPFFRKSLKSQVFQNEKLWKVWSWSLLKATYAEYWVSVKTGKGTTEVHLLPGQFIFGRTAAAKELAMKGSTVYGLMGKLKKMQNLDIQSNSHYSVVTITNWSFYQKLMKKVTGNPAPNRHPTDTFKNVKKNSFPQNSIEFQLSELLLSLILERRPSFKKPDLQQWAKHIDSMIRLDHRDPDEIERVIRWCQADSFWQVSILSTAKLRNQYDQLCLRMEKDAKKADVF
jgi:hypothetical protein